nr:MAG TPA: hypothetical protein [Caudoviricetes sp.]
MLCANSSNRLLILNSPRVVAIVSPFLKTIRF